METHALFGPAVPLHVVSNPLGWDGDLFSVRKHQRMTTVSNPLGWDGDGKSASSSASTTLVSNPLGWDGDAATAVIGEEA